MERRTQQFISWEQSLLPYLVSSLHHTEFVFKVTVLSVEKLGADIDLDVSVCQGKIVVMDKNEWIEFYYRSSLEDDHEFQQLSVWNIGFVTLSLLHPHHHEHSSYLKSMSDSPE